MACVVLCLDPCNAVNRMLLLVSLGVSREAFDTPASNLAALPGSLWWPSCNVQAIGRGLFGFILDGKA